MLGFIYNYTHVVATYVYATYVVTYTAAYVHTNILTPKHMYIHTYTVAIHTYVASYSEITAGSDWARHFLHSRCSYQCFL